MGEYSTIYIAVDPDYAGPRYLCAGVLCASQGVAASVIAYLGVPGIVYPHENHAHAVFWMPTGLFWASSSVPFDLAIMAFGPLNNYIETYAYEDRVELNDSASVLVEGIRAGYYLYTVIVGAFPLPP